MLLKILVSSKKSTNGHSSQSSNCSRVATQKSQLTLLKEEYDPPFELASTWKAEEFYRVKIPHPFIEDQKETVEFPLLSSSGSIADRAIHYQDVLDLQESVGFDGDNGPNLYFTFTRCLRGQALIDWKTIMNRRTNEQRTPENFADDIDEFVKTNDSRDNEELLQAQVNYMNHLKKPRSMKPSDFKAHLITLNNHIASIPGADDNDKLDENRLKSIFMDAMPPQWRKDFKKFGRRLHDETNPNPNPNPNL